MSDSELVDEMLDHKNLMVQVHAQLTLGTAYGDETTPPPFQPTMPTRPSSSIDPAS